MSTWHSYIAQGLSISDTLQETTLGEKPRELTYSVQTTWTQSAVSPRQVTAFRLGEKTPSRVLD